VELHLDTSTGKKAKASLGSFTGLRVGAAVVNTLNFALGRKVKLKELKYE
jgi:hypothetical protein